MAYKNKQLKTGTVNRIGASGVVIGASDLDAQEPSVFALDLDSRLAGLGLNPTLDLDFARQKYRVYNGTVLSDVADPFSSLITTVRATNAGYFDAFGVFREETADVPRISYDPLTGRCLGLQVSPTRTNLFLNSGTPVTQDIAVTAQAYTLSFYGPGEIVMSGAATGTLTNTGTAVSRVHTTFTPTAGTLTLTVTGCDKVQITPGSFPTMYIPTAGSAVARNADQISISGAQFTPWFSASEGTLLLISTWPVIIPNITRMTLSNGTVNNRIVLRSSSTGLVPQCTLVSGGTTLGYPYANDPLVYTGIATALTFKNNYFGISTNGKQAANGASVLTSYTVPTIDRISIGASHTGIVDAETCIERILYFPKCLEDYYVELSR